MRWRVQGRYMARRRSDDEAFGLERNLRVGEKLVFSKCCNENEGS